MPAVRARINAPRGTSDAILTLLDTGAIVSIAEFGIARQLGLEVRQDKKIKVSGIGGGRLAYAGRDLLDISIGNPRKLTIQQVELYFVEGPLPFPLVLGHHSALERMDFLQLYSGSPRFLVRPLEVAAPA